jgi:hypothetical protein
MSDIGEKTTSVAEEFSKRKRKQIIISIPMMLAIVSIFFSGDGPDSEIFGISSSIYLPVFIAVFLGMFVFSLINWRCPSCRKYLGRGMNPKHCSGCGVQLHD